MEIDIQKNIEKSDREITLVDILNGKINYSIPDINMDLDNLHITRKNIIEVLNLCNILKYFQLSSYNIETDKDDKGNRGKEMIEGINEWLNVDITI